MHDAPALTRPARPFARLAGLAAAAAVLVTLLGAAGPASVGAIAYPTSAPMMLQNVNLADLQANTHRVCDGSFSHVIKNVGATQTTTSAVNYLNAAKACGLKVVFHFSATISGGTVYPSRVARWVNAVKSHPALDGYLSVKEPSWIGINATEIRALFKAFKAADRSHPVYALFGDIPHFGDSVNPYGSGMADIVMVDWYPVETANGGCSTYGTSYLTSGTKWMAKVKRVVATKTPGRPVYAMVQTHKYLAPRCHKKQLPSKSLLFRQVREAFTYGGATGIAFHTWSNPNYAMDQRRNPTMIGYMKELGRLVRAGTFS